MGQAYDARISTLHDGNIISAALFNNEYNAILNAFSTTGHQHDGTAGEGGAIHTIGDSDFLNKIVIESDEIKFFIEVGGASVEQLNLVDGVLAPETTNDIDLGTSSKRFKTIYATTLDVSTDITNSQLANSTVSYGGVSLALGASDATPAFNLSDATNYPTSSLSGTITNAQLAGSIANDKLSNSTVSFGGVSLALGASDATPAFDLTDATGYPAGSLSGTISGIQIASGAIVESRLADDAVTQAKIADNAVGSSQLAAASVIFGKLATSAVSAAAIQSNAITTTKIADDAVTTAKIADDAVDTAQITDSAVTNSKIANAAVTNTKLSDFNVTNTKIASSAVTGVKIASSTVTNANLAGSILGSKFSKPVTLDDYRTSATDTTLILNNINSTSSSNGRAIDFKVLGSLKGGIGNSEILYGSGVFITGQGGGIMPITQQGTIHRVVPCTSVGQFYDNALDLGSSSARWDDVYATNGTIQTSDRNEKQNIEELSDAERRAAVAAKGLMRKFKWKDAVEEKGDNARTHFGIIAQDLEDAFTAEGLDAADYGLFTSNTWWEHTVEIPAVAAVEAKEAVFDEDGYLVTAEVKGSPASEAYTKVDCYETEEEAPEGAVHKTRRGVRYNELLAFIIAAI